MGLKENAKVKLEEAYEDALVSMNATCNHKEFIDFVIDNTHLTYKYILFTAILSKATDDSINPLCLQKKSTLSGAYDARTVCHKVIVKFEMETLEKAMGGSNEPFLNKPARFPELSKDNAVRRGNDKLILDSLCDNLPAITTSTDAYDCLVYLLTKLILIRDAKKSLTQFSIPDAANLPSKLMTFIERALERSYEGEVLTLLVAGIYHLRYNHPTDIVEVHPVNQSGASSREISDIDVYAKGKLIFSNELKDKDYDETDIRHAADKVLAVGGNRMLFIEGPRVATFHNFIFDIEKEYSSRNFMLRVIPCRLFFALNVGSIEIIDCEEYMRFILQTACDTKFKEDVIIYLDGLAKEIFDLTR
jgi:banII